MDSFDVVLRVGPNENVAALVDFRLIPFALLGYFAVVVAETEGNVDLDRIGRRPRVTSRIESRRRL